MKYQNGPEGMHRVERLPDAVIECLIRRSMFYELANRYDGEDCDRLFALIHDVAEEVLARVDLPKPSPVTPTQDLVAAIEALHCLNPFADDNCRLYNAGFLAARSKAAALVAAHLEGGK